jgi:hypothetical protein
MGDVVAFKRPSLKDKHKGNSLCRSNHHKWQVVNDNPFDSQQGGLVTCYRCTRCGKTKNKAH